MDTTNLTPDDDALVPAETEQQLRRRIIQLIMELCMLLEHDLLLDLADYALGISACSRATVFFPQEGGRHHGCV